MHSIFRLLALCLPLAAMAPALAHAPRPESRLTPQQLQQDLRFLQEAIAKTHPAPSHSVKPDALAQAYRDIEARFTAPMSRDEAWRLMSTLNPVFSDAHMSVVPPDRERLMRAHLEQGGRFFPYEVVVEQDGSVFIKAELGGGASALSGMRIDSINGMPASELAVHMLARSYGDTAALRANVLSDRWWLYYWKMVGAPEQYELQLSKAGQVQVVGKPGSKAIPALMRDDVEFERNYRLDMLPDHVALLTVGSFLWPDKARFFAFAEQAFTTLRDKKVKTLLIDVRDNGGGDDDMWKQGLLKYIADKPFRNGSDYVKMVIPGRASGSEKVGDIVRGQVDSWVQPQLSHPLHYSGKVYVLVGRMTYSSAVLFANVMQDFKFATLVGAPGVADTRTTGGVQQFVLPHTGLGLTIPRFVLDRPAGQKASSLLQPDIVMTDDPFNRRALIDALHARLR